MSGVSTGPRGCGTRVSGALYLTCPLSPTGLPLEAYLIDPPIHEIVLPGEDEPTPIAEAFGMSALGITITPVDRLGSGYHVLDWIGSAHYPNAADFLEEVRNMGLSRRISKAANFELLDRRSRIVVCHPAGYIDKWEVYYHSEHVEFNERHPCPKPAKNDKHAFITPLGENDEMCSRLWWQDIKGGEETVGPASRRVRRVMPSFEYEGAKPPDNVITKRRLAMCAAFPISQIEAIVDREGGTHEDAMQKAQKGQIPVRLEEA